MLRTTLLRHRFPALLLCGLLAVALSFAQAQSNKAEKRLSLRDVVVREGQNLVRPKPGFEFVKASKTSVSVRRHGSNITLGTLNCTVCPGGACLTQIHPDGSNSCIGCENNHCFVSPF